MDPHKIYWSVSMCLSSCVLSDGDLVTFLVSFPFLSIYWVIHTLVLSFPRGKKKFSYLHTNSNWQNLFLSDNIQFIYNHPHKTPIESQEFMFSRRVAEGQIFLFSRGAYLITGCLKVCMLNKIIKHLNCESQYNWLWYFRVGSDMTTWLQEN